MLRQKEKHMKNQTCFMQAVNEFKQAKTREQQRKSQLEQRANASLSLKQKSMKKMLDSLLPRAVANIQKILSQEKGFGNYLVWLFENRANSFDDSTSSCGFQPRPLQFKVCNDASTITNMKAEVKDIIGSREEYEVHVSVLVLYREYELERNRNSLHGGSPRNGQVLALTALRSHQFGKPEICQIKDFRLVMVYESVDLRLDTAHYSATTLVSLDPGFADTLRKLSSTASTFKFLLNRFGPMP